jgi:hypothetical protein
MFAIALKDEAGRLRARLGHGLAQLKPPAKRLALKALKVAYPLVLIGVSVFLASFGVYWSAALALAAATILITRGFAPGRRGKQRMEIAAAGAFCLAVAFGLPSALYTFSTEPCLGFAANQGLGDVRTLDDPRIKQDDRYWVQRAAARLAPLWPKDGLPPLTTTALANIVVQARALVHEISWRGETPLTRLGLTEAKEAYAALHFDRRKVCYLYGTGERAHGLYLTNDELRMIADETERALALILPALQATYDEALPAVDGVQLAGGNTAPIN